MVLNVHLKEHTCYLKYDILPYARTRSRNVRSVRLNKIIQRTLTRQERYIDIKSRSQRYRCRMDGEHSQVLLVQYFLIHLIAKQFKLRTHILLYS